MRYDAVYREKDGATNSLSRYISQIPKFEDPIS
jgi:hypothetical protein